MNSYSNKEMDTTIRFIGELYRRLQARNNVLEIENRVVQNQDIYDEGKEFIEKVNNLISECSRSSQLILKREYLDDAPAGWYELYYSSSTYYRLKTKAMSEFMENLHFEQYVLKP